nr:hypothetical protein [Tanacetum cinerariifolium]
MADVNVSALADQAPTMAPLACTNDQILPHIRWVPIGKITAIWMLKDKKNLAQQTQEKKKATLTVIPSIWFTKLIIYYLQSKHKFHPRPNSLLHLPNEESVLRYLKFSAKGTKREVFGMHIPARRSKLGLVTKRRKPTSSLRSVGKSIDEGIPKKEPRFNDEEAEVQRELEESLKSVYNAPQGPLPSVVIREPESGKYQPLPEVQGKGKEKVTDEQVALDLLTLQTPKKKSPADHEVESDKDVPGLNPGEQDEGQAGPNPGEEDAGQARPNPGDAVASQPQSSHVVHAGPNLEHMNLEATDVSTQPYPKQMDEGLSFGDLFLNDKPYEADNEKTTAEIEAELMMSVTIQQDASSIPPMTTPIIDLTSRPDSLNVHRPLQATVTKTTTTTTTHPPPPLPQQSTTDSMLMKCIGELEHIMANLIQDNKHLEERLDSHGTVYTHWRI